MPSGHSVEHVFQRRVVVFCCTLLLACAASLTYVYSRPPIYRAVARIQISPAALVSDEGDSTKTPTLRDNPQAFLTEVQVLTSRPLLGEAIASLRANGHLPMLGGDPVNAVQEMLQVDPVEGTQIAQLAATASDPAFASDLVNAVASTYSRQVADTFRTRTTGTYTDIEAEADALARQVTAKQKAVDAYREQSDIVSLERQENTVLANVGQLSQTYALSSQKLAAALGHLNALKEAAAEGRPLVQAKDDPTLANLEQRVSLLREQLQDLQRRYTPDFIALDADARALKARVANLEDQLKAQRTASEKQALLSAQADVTGAQGEVARLQRDLNDNKHAAQELSGQLARYKVLQDDLDHLQTMERQTQDRLMKLKASEQERAPKVEILEPATPDSSPWRPLYTRDAAIAVMGSLVLALFATWLVEYIMGPKPGQGAVIYQPIAPAAPVAALERYAPPSLSRPSPSHLLQIAAPEPPRRELRTDEAAALLAEASDDVRLIVAAMLSGLSASEIAQLRWDEVDLADARTQAGEPKRMIRLEEPLLHLLHARTPAGAKPSGLLLHDEGGAPLASEDLDRLLFFGAYDAGLEKPQEITAALLRRTYILFLLRQGVRTGELAQILGSISQAELAGYMQQVTPGPRQPPERTIRIHPGLAQPLGAL